MFPAAPIMVSRGCPGQCTYCQTKNISPPHPLPLARERARRDPPPGSRARRQGDPLPRRRHHRQQVKFVRAFCDLLKREPYKLRLQVANGLRADMVNAEILTALRDVGLSNVGFGVESGNDRVLKIIKKGISKDSVRKAVQTAKDLGLETWAFFLFGLPGDTEESIRDTVDFAIELNPKYAKFAILKPFPGSEAYYQLDEKGLVDTRDRRSTASTRRRCTTSRRCRRSASSRSSSRRCAASTCARARCSSTRATSARSASSSPSCAAVSSSSARCACGGGRRRRRSSRPPTRRPGSSCPPSTDAHGQA
ncbi:MAG: radical SAM protein [Candidatus Binatia bacterium]